MTDLLHNTTGCVPCTDQLFTKPTQRRGTNSYKWDSAPSADIIPLWVADMDFETYPAITQALQRRVAHGIFGYTRVPDVYYESVCKMVHNAGNNADGVVFRNIFIDSLRKKNCLVGSVRTKV